MSDNAEIMLAMTVLVVIPFLILLFVSRFIYKKIKKFIVSNRESKILHARDQNLQKLKKELEDDSIFNYIEIYHYEGLGLSRDDLCKVTLSDNSINVMSTRTNNKFTLPIDRLMAVEYKDIEEFKHVEKSIIGRAVIGNILIPGLGGIVGGISGTKTMESDGVRGFFIVNYINKDSELQGITFSNKEDIEYIEDFTNKLNNILNISKESKTIEL